MKIKIASPCPARWEEMSGDERSRFCRHCQKHVYNFVTMNRDEIQTLIQEKEGKLCVRIYQRQDGTILTNDCPVGLSRVVRRIKIMVCSAAAALVLSLSAAAAANSTDEMDRVRARIRAHALWDDTVWKVKGWFGINRPIPLAGEPAIALPPTPCKTTNTLTDYNLLTGRTSSRPRAMSDTSAGTQ